jgi:hypothetical protein
MRWRSRNQPLDWVFQARLVRLADRGLDAWTTFQRMRGPRRHRRATGTLLPPGCPILWVPAAVLARLRKEYGFAHASHLGFRKGLFDAEVRAIASERLGIRVQRPRPVARCPSCGEFVPFFQLEGDWACRHCALEPCRGLEVRIGWYGAYRALGIWNRHARDLRTKLAHRLLVLGGQARTLADLAELVPAGAVIGEEPFGWTGPRAPRRPGSRAGQARLPRPLGRQIPFRESGGPLHRALAPFWADAAIDVLLCPEAYRAYVQGLTDVTSPQLSVPIESSTGSRG